MKALWITIGIIAAVLVIGGIYFLSTQSNANPSTTPINTNTNTATTAQIYDVNIANFAFSPSSLTIKKGDSVKWTNTDSASHTVISDSGSEISSSSLSNGQTYTHIFNTAGTYDYHCSIHPSMKAAIIVQ